MSKTPRLSDAAGSPGRSPAAGATAPAAPAGATSAAAIGAAQAAVGDKPREVAEAAAGANLASRPQDAAGAAEAVQGSALDAPGVGSGPVGERFSDVNRLGSAIEADGRAVHRSLMGGTQLSAYAEDDPVLDTMRTAFADPANADAVAQLRRELGVAPAGIEVEAGAGAGAVEPQVMSREGAFGARTERRALPTVETLLARRTALAADVAGIAVTGAKLARQMPATNDELDDLRDAGFDLVVISRQAGFRRAGVAHPTAPTLRRSQDFEVHEIEAMARDPMLVVQALR